MAFIHASPMIPNTDFFWIVKVSPASAEQLAEYNPKFRGTC